MNQAILSTELSGKQSHRRLLLIPRIVFSAIYPMDKLGAHALEKVGAAIIVEDSDWGKGGNLWRLMNRYLYKSISCSPPSPYERVAWRA